MKRSAAKKKKRPKKPGARPSLRRQPDPVYEAISRREQETVVEIITGGQRPERALEVGVSALIWADQALARFDSESDLPRPLACRTGCDHCCFNQVELTPPEALVIGHFVELHFSLEERERLLVSTKEALRVKAGKGKREIAKIRRELPCPLLQAQKCSVYLVRPLVCRAMHSLDAGQCQSSLQAGDLSSGDYYFQRHEIVQAIARGVQAGSRTMGCQAGFLDLARALLDYFQQPDPLERWIRGEPVFSL
jgi:Fe-S-cluster containining protein